MTVKTAVSNILLREVSEEDANNFVIEEQAAVYAYLRYEAYSLNSRRRLASRRKMNKPLIESLEIYNDELMHYDDILFDPIMHQYFN